MISGWQNVTEKFALDSTTGIITTKEELDREVTSEYLLCIQANRDANGGKKKREVGGRVRRSMEEDLQNRTNHDKVLYLKVIVEDANDNGPVFNDKLLKNGTFMFKLKLILKEISLVVF